MSMENHGEIVSTEETSLFFHQTSMAILPAEKSGKKQEERA
jgi:hypothetical protein